MRWGVSSMGSPPRASAPGGDGGQRGRPAGGDLQRGGRVLRDQQYMPAPGWPPRSGFPRGLEHHLPVAQLDVRRDDGRKRRQPGPEGPLLRDARRGRKGPGPAGAAMTRRIIPIAVALLVLTGSGLRSQEAAKTPEASNTQTPPV